MEGFDSGVSTVLGSDIIGTHVIIVLKLGATMPFLTDV